MNEKVLNQIKEDATIHPLEWLMLQRLTISSVSKDVEQKSLSHTELAKV